MLNEWLGHSAVYSIAHQLRKSNHENCVPRSDYRYNESEKTIPKYCTQRYDGSNPRHISNRNFARFQWTFV